MEEESIVLGLVVPCYNEEKVIEVTIRSLSSKIQELVEKGKISCSSFIGIVDDGSKDKTWEKVNELNEHFEGVRGIKLSTNFGHQNALWAGLDTWHKDADCLITIDADLQDDIDVIEEMLAEHENGAQIVYGVRANRDRDTFLKRFTANAFYKLMKVLGANTIENHADFRLADSKVIREILQFPEVNLFLRGMFTMVGFEQAMVYYKRLNRTRGKTKYPFRKMLSFALDGITSFSIMPLRLIAILGILVCFVSICFGAFAFYSYFILDVVRGWASTVVPMYFLGGVQLLGVGILGEYLGKVYMEIKQRPRFIVNKRLN